MQKITGLLAAIALLAGLFFLSEATMGVGLIAVAGSLGVWVRISQAEKHHKEIKEMLQPTNEA